MVSPSQRRTLLVDDDEELLIFFSQLLEKLSNGNWQVTTTTSAAQALELLQQEDFALLVLDLHMPVMDGVQFLKLLRHKYPKVLKVVLTGDTSKERRAECLNSGADLFFEKPTSGDRWQEIYHQLAVMLDHHHVGEVFRGVLKKVGIQDVIQIECLTKHSSILDIVAGKEKGRIYIEEGRILHACVGNLQPKEAFYHLATLARGEFSLKPFETPPCETLAHAQWEGLLLEAGQWRDEQSSRQAARIPAQPVPTLAPPQIEEILLYSNQGDVLFELHCPKASKRLELLEFLSQKCNHLAKLSNCGGLTRIEAHSGTDRIVVVIHEDRTMFLKAQQPKAEAPPQLDWQTALAASADVLALGVWKGKAEILASSNAHSQTVLTEIFRAAADCASVLAHHRAPNDCLILRFERGHLHIFDKKAAGIYGVLLSIESEPTCGALAALARAEIAS